MKRAFRLTDRETETLELLASGFSRKAMAEKMFVSENTVNAHIKSLYNKTDCHKKDQIISLMEEIPLPQEKSEQRKSQILAALPTVYRCR